jgi:pyridoxal phosphate enzyme (YggS family)
VSVAANLVLVRERIANACRRAGRRAAGVRIVAVSKTQPLEAVLEAIASGVDAIGENRVQEGMAKRSFCPANPPWHLIGPLQRNKAAHALDTFDTIETIDRVELADRLESLLVARQRVVPIFIEVNVGGEEQKSGCTPASAPALVEHLRRHCSHLQLQGLMTVPPYDPNPERSRPQFAALRLLACRLQADLGLAPLELSMGMSEDYPVAVEEGATWVRLGRVLFGERRPNA